MTSESRAEWGLKMLGEDIYNWLHGKPLNDSNNNENTMVESNCKPIVQNIINNYTHETQTPTQKVKFNFIDVVKIAFCIIVIVIVSKIAFDPAGFVDGFDSIVRFFHSF